MIDLIQLVFATDAWSYRVEKFTYYFISIYMYQMQRNYFKHLFINAIIYLLDDLCFIFTSIKLML